LPRSNAKEREPLLHSPWRTAIPEHLIRAFP
jgi:hypothetical protein